MYPHTTIARAMAVLLLAVILLPVGSAQALLDVREALRETPEPPVDLSTIVTYPAQVPAPGDVLADPLVVTDAELASAGSTGSTLTLAAGAVDFIVDDDLAQCPDAAFTTATGIQQAVAAAPPGSRIRVCPGRYSPVTVNKTLTLEAPRQHGQATQCPASLIPDPSKDAIVDANNTGAIGFTLGANDIVLYGFWVQHTSGNPGIYTLPAFSGYEILFNVVQQNTFGLYLNASGAAETLVSHNCFRFNNQPGAASGDGLYSDQGLRNAVVQENYFTGHDSASMVFALNQQDIVVQHNDVIDDAGSIVLVSTQNALVQHNNLRTTRGSGVFLGGGVTATTVQYNRITNPGGTGVVSTVLFSPSPNQVAIVKNHVTGSPFDGIRLDSTDTSTVRGNKVERNARDGIRLRNGSDLNIVRDNLSRDNGRDGTRIEGGSSGNTIEQNKMLGNVEHDCHDDTIGAGTGGTANFWIKDIGKTENRPGLCKNATTTP